MMADETSSIWADIKEKIVATFDWLASWVGSYPKTALIIMIIALLAQAFM